MSDLLKRADFRRFAELVVDKNRRLNLTGAGSVAEVARRHLADGLAPLAWLRRRFPSHPLGAPLPSPQGRGQGVGPTLADVGAGAGFVGLALKLAWPELRLTLVESRQRRADFLEWTVATLGLRGVAVLRTRAEAVPRRFDIVIERALAPLPDALALCLPLTRPGGFFLAYQSSAAAPGPPAAALVDTVQYRLSGEDRDRFILCFCRLLPSSTGLAPAPPASPRPRSDTS